MAFKVGDVVELKSGGPRMVVNAFAASGRVECVWQNATTNGWQTKSDGFLPDVLIASGQRPGPEPLVKS